MSFTLKETKSLYEKLLSNKMIPETKREKELLKKLNIKYKKKKKKKKKSIKRGSNILVYFELDREECTDMNLPFSEDKMSSYGTVTHFIKGRVKKIINKTDMKVYFPIDKTTQIVSKDTVKLL